MLNIHPVHRQLSGKSARTAAQMTPQTTIDRWLSRTHSRTFRFQIPLVGLLHRPKLLLFGLIAAYVLTRISFISHIEFPYHDDANGNPTPQRHFVTVGQISSSHLPPIDRPNDEFARFVFFLQHTLRTLYDQQGRVTYSDSGYWFREFDRNVEKTIDGVTAPESPVRQEENPICKVAPFCGLPFYSCRQLHTG